MMLKGHTYKSFKTAPSTPECREACLADFIMSKLQHRYVYCNMRVKQPN